MLTYNGSSSGVWTLTGLALFWYMYKCSSNYTNLEKERDEDGERKQESDSPPASNNSNVVVVNKDRSLDEGRKTSEPLATTPIVEVDLWEMAKAGGAEVCGWFKSDEKLQEDREFVAIKRNETTAVQKDNEMWKTVAATAGIFALGVIGILSAMPDANADHRNETLMDEYFEPQGNDHDHQKRKFNSKYEAEIVCKSMKQKQRPGYEKLNVYYNAKLESWFIGKSRF